MAPALCGVLGYGPDRSLALEEPQEEEGSSMITVENMGLTMDGRKASVDPVALGSRKSPISHRLIVRGSGLFSGSKAQRRLMGGAFKYRTDGELVYFQSGQL
jgi:hypothetical protein